MLAPNPAHRPPAAVRPAPSGSGAPCPYRGLAVFEARHAEAFHGRERLTAALLARLAERAGDPRPLLVGGASGSGKSSLLRAGLLPALDRGALGGARGVLFTPTADPLGALAAALPPPGGERVVLVVDQFEEVFTQCEDEAGRAAFIRALHAAASDGSALVVAAVRADFYGRCAEYPELRAALEGGQVVVGPMTPAELRAAIERPAASAGLELEPGLAEVLLNDYGGSEAGRLPLLSHALLATWRERSGDTLTVAGYLRTGGIAGALAATADRVLAGLDEPGRTAARELFLHLVRVGEGAQDTRLRLDRGRLAAELPDPAAAEKALAAFAADDARLITMDERSVEITHEALLTAWPTLRGWLDEGRAGLLAAQHLAEAARAWEREARDPGGLYRGTRLALAREWAERGERRLGPLAREFLEASVEREAAEAHAARRRARRGLVATAVIAALAVLVPSMAALALYSRSEAERQRRVAEARDLAIGADLVEEVQPELALRLGMAAVSLSGSADDRARLASRVMAYAPVSTLAGHGDEVRAVAVAPGGRAAATGGQDGTLLLWDLADPYRVPAPARVAVPMRVVRSLAYAPGGDLLLAGGDRRTAVLFRLVPGGPPVEVARMTGESTFVNAVAFAPDGRTALLGGLPPSLWDLSDPARPRRLPWRAEAAFAAAYGPGGLLVTGGQDSSVTVWDARDPRDPRELATMRGQPEGRRTTGLALSGDGRVLVAGDQGNSASVWDLAEPAAPRRAALLAGHSGEVAAVAFAGRDPVALTAGDDRRAYLWDLGDPYHPQQIEALTGHDGPIAAAASDPSGRYVVTASADRSAVVWRASGVPRLATLRGEPGHVLHAAFAPDGRRALTAGTGGGAALWDVADPRRPARLATVGEEVAQAVFAGSSGRVLTASGDGAALWDVAGPASPRELAALPDPEGGVLGVAAAPDGRTALTFGENGRVLLWTLAPGAAPRATALTGHPGVVLAAAFSPDGRRALTAGAEGAVLLWDLPQGAPPRLAARLAGHRSDVPAVAFAPDGARALTGGADGRAILWDLTARPPARIAVLGHTAQVDAVGFGPGGITAITIGFDDAGSVWNLTDPSRPRELATVRGMAATAAYAPGGRALLTGGRSGAAVLWDAGLTEDVARDPMRAACRLARRGLDAAEWRQYVTAEPVAEPCAR
ncbi:nSTAND1 domain-containing NTPase [Thermocatellispora tengchongensis]|uniref:nSTAND1 domain-containing NTPase n=1 Tax=Thermocatellispora tengchongensis TaxID=1073253 RepID=UPI00363B03FC